MVRLVPQREPHPAAPRCAKGRLGRSLALPGAVLGTLFVVACQQQEPEYQVKDLRILAVKAEPPEVLYSFLHIVPAAQRGGLPLGPYGMTLQVLAVDPQGREVELTSRLCPEAANGACPGYKLRPTAPAEQANAVLPLLTPETYDRQADLTLGGEISVPSLPHTFSGDVMDYMIPHDSHGRVDSTAMLFPSTPFFVLRVATKDDAEQEVAIKRFALSMDITPAGQPLPQQVEQVFTQALGVTFCAADQDLLADVQCIKPRKANQNPAIVRVLYNDGEGSGWRDLSGRISTKLGRNIRLRPVLRSDDHEPYQAFAINGTTGKMTLKNYVEDPVFLWFTTVGSTQRVTQASTGQGGFGGGFGRGGGREECTDPDTCEEMQEDTRYATGFDAPPGPAAVWLVVQDQRGGVDWRRLDFDIQDVPSVGGGPGGGGGPFGGGGGGGGGGPGG